MFSGVGPLSLAGTGIVVLTGDDTCTGATAIGRGATLRLGGGGTTGSIAGTSGVADDGALVFDRADTVRVAPAITGSGTLTQAGRGTTILTGRNTYTGATTVAGGTLQVDGVLTASEEPAAGFVPAAPARANSALWGKGLGTFGSTRGDGNAVRLTRETGGFVLGLETGSGALTLPGLDDLRVGVAAGHSASTLDIPARLSRGQVESVCSVSTCRFTFTACSVTGGPSGRCAAGAGGLRGRRAVHDRGRPD